ncbi:MAG: hypothetical protein RX318_12230, partial [bacterium]|nr:hypothetical protein [bacterium]
RDYLEAVLANNHRLVITHEISDEWARHQSNFSRGWRRRMYARKNVFALNVDASTSVVTRLKYVKCTEKERDAMLNRTWGRFSPRHRCIFCSHKGLLEIKWAILPILHPCKA